MMGQPKAAIKRSNLRSDAAALPMFGQARNAQSLVFNARRKPMRFLDG
jgi:hypothetical protein